MTYPGLDRRAHGLIPALRRLGYGLLLWSGQTLAQQDPASAQVRVRIDALPATAHESPDRYQVRVSTADPRLSPAWQRFAERLGMDLRRYEWISVVERIGDGIALDVDLAASGQLHLLLHPREDAMGEGLRWSVTEAERRSWREPRLWAVGPALSSIDALPRWRSHGEQEETDLWERRLVVTQQLMLDADRAFGLRGDALLTLEHAPWIDQHAGDISGRVIQLRLSWRF